MTMGRYLATIAAVLACSSAATAADLSPGHWPAATRTELEQQDALFTPLYAGPVKADRILVTGTISPVAVHAGVEALRHGGTAADAAATVALTQITTYLGSVVSFAGVSELLYYDAKTKKVYALDAGWASYQHETDPATIPAADDGAATGNPAIVGAGVGALGRQTLVPGFMAGIEAMHTRFGRLPFADLFQPAIWYAENGVEITSGLAGYFRFRQKLLWRTPDGRRFASMPDGSLPKAGDLFKQPDLALTLKAVAAQGSAYMYAGDWARAYVAAVRAEGGKVTLDDLAGYKPLWRDPFSIQFAGATVFGPGEDPGGGCSTLEALNLLSGLKIGTLGPYWRDPQALIAYSHALAFAYAADGRTNVTTFEQGHGLAADCGARLSPAFSAAVAPNLASLLGAPKADQAPVADQQTEAVVVVDRWGNVAALVHTINTVDWGDTGIVVGGIPVSDAGGYYRNEPLVMKPGQRLPNGLSPVIALRDGKPVMAVAAVGLSLMPETTRLIAGTLANGLDLQTVMAAPPLLLNVSPFDPAQPLAARAEVVPAGAYDPAMLKALTAEGVPVREETAQSVGGIRGTAVAAMIDPSNGRPLAVEVPGVFGFAESDVQRHAAPPTNAAPQILDRYVGDYELGPKRVARVRREADYLVVRVTGQPYTLSCAAAADQAFDCRLANIQLAFSVSADGKTNGVTIHQNGADHLAPRIDEAEAARIEAALSQSSGAPTGR